MAISSVSNPFVNHPMWTNKPKAHSGTSSEVSSQSKPAETLTNITSAAGPKIAIPGAWEDILVQRHTRPVGPPDNASENLYAQVRVDGKVVATLYNGGSAELSNEAWAKIDTLQQPDLVGPELAQWRAEKYARLLGGTIEKAQTALSQQEWDALPPREYALDVEAMNIALQQMQQATHHRQSLYQGMPQHAARTTAAVDVDA